MVKSESKAGEVHRVIESGNTFVAMEAIISNLGGIVQITAEI